jgi:hypothetical protein
MIYKSFLTSIIVIAFMPVPMRLNAQGVSMDQYTVFGSRIKNPVVVDVRTEQQTIYFNVNNKSFYNYGFKVKFGDFRNLSPRVFLYAGPDNQLIQANMLQGTKVNYPEDVIEKEMNKREANKYEKHSLY